MRPSYRVLLTVLLGSLGVGRAEGHFPKALAGNPAELNGMKPFGKLPLEVVATCDGDQVRLVALKDGKPLPRAEFVTVDARLLNTKLTAEDDGVAAWKPPAAGNYA